VVEEVEVEVVAAPVEVEAVEAMVEVEMEAETVVEAMVVVETEVVEMVAELPESITSTLQRHKSTTLLLTHTRIKLTLSRQLQLQPLLWQLLPL